MTSSIWLTRPVFISSTFRDMQAERDYLRHVLFPRLEEELRKGRIQFEAIDLRQGVETADVPDEAAREHLVLKVCLEEIQRIRTFLIVLLGDRYGWVPPEERMAAAVEEAGFATDLTDRAQHLTWLRARQWPAMLISRSVSAALLRRKRSEITSAFQVAKT